MNWTDIIPYVATWLFFSALGMLGKARWLTKAAKCVGGFVGASLGFNIYGVLNNEYSLGLSSFFCVLTIISVWLYGKNLYLKTEPLWGFLFHLFGNLTTVTLLVALHFIR